MNTNVNTQSFTPAAQLIREEFFFHRKINIGVATKFSPCILDLVSTSVSIVFIGGRIILEKLLHISSSEKKTNELCIFVRNTVFADLIAI